MLGRFISRLIIWISGWHINSAVPPGYERSVMLAVPHTSNWDIIFARAAFSLLRVPVKFTIKKEWLRPPFGWLIKPLGGIGIDRTPKQPGQPRKSMVDAMSHLFETHEGPLVVMVTPEGTRSLAKEWKSGFYHVAKLAGVPIALGYLDYGKKEAGVGGIVNLSDDFEADMRKIMDFYKDKTAKYPEKFSLDQRFR